MAKFKASQFNHFVPLGDGRELTFNALSRNLEVLGKNDVAFVHELGRGTDHNPDDARVARFSKAGYVLLDEVDEIGVVREMYATARFKTTQLTLTIMPTAACNFGCDYCFQGADKPQEWMSKKVQAQLLAFVENKMPDLKNLSVTWYGGEPLLGMQVIRDMSKEFLAMCGRHGVSLSFMVVTNGYRLSKEVADELKSLGVGHIQVTLDGPCEIHDQRRHLLGGQGTYKKIVENLAEAVNQKGIFYSVRVNVDSRDAQYVNELLEDLAARGLNNHKNLSVYPAPVESYTEGCHVVSDFVMTRQQYADVEVAFLNRGRKLKLIGSPTPPIFSSQCGAIKESAFVVTPTGDLHKCWNTVNEPDKKVGSIFDPERLKQPNPNHDMWLSWTPFQDPICRSCSTLPLCSGNCAFLHKEVKTDLKTPNSRPCPSWKYNLPQKLLMLAVDRKLIPADFVVKTQPAVASAPAPALAAVQS